MRAGGTRHRVPPPPLILSRRCRAHCGGRRRWKANSFSAALGGGALGTSGAPPGHVALNKCAQEKPTQSWQGVAWTRLTQTGPGPACHLSIGAILEQDIGSPPPRHCRGAQVPENTSAMKPTKGKPVEPQGINTVVIFVGSEGPSCAGPGYCPFSLQGSCCPGPHRAPWDMGRARRGRIGNFLVQRFVRN